jgi:hypothetical protein
MEYDCGVVRMDHGAYYILSVEIAASRHVTGPLTLVLPHIRKYLSNKLSLGWPT